MIITPMLNFSLIDFSKFRKDHNSKGCPNTVNPKLEYAGTKANDNEIKIVNNSFFLKWSRIKKYMPKKATILTIKLLIKYASNESKNRNNNLNGENGEWKYFNATPPPILFKIAFWFILKIFSEIFNKWEYRNSALRLSSVIIKESPPKKIKGKWAPNINIIGKRNFL